MTELRRPQTFDEMRALLESRALPSRLADLCRPAAALVEDPAGLSRIGGLPRLAAGTPWPTGINGPLPHVASIALDDLPEGVRPSIDGELAIFVIDGTTWPFERGTHFQVVHTPAAALGEPTSAPAVPPASGDPSPEFGPFRTWTEVRLSAQPTVALPWEPGMGVGEWASERLSGEESEALDELAEEMDEHAPAASERGHLVYGAPPALADGSEGPPILIQLSSQLSYFEHGEGAWIFGDVWHLVIRGDVEAFRRGDLSRLDLDAAV